MTLPIPFPAAASFAERASPCRYRSWTPWCRPSRVGVGGRILRHAAQDDRDPDEPGILRSSFWPDGDRNGLQAVAIFGDSEDYRREMTVFSGVSHPGGGWRHAGEKGS